MSGVGVLNLNGGDPIIGKCGRDCTLCPAFQQRIEQAAKGVVKVLSIDMNQGPVIEGSFSDFLDKGWTNGKR